MDNSVKYNIDTENNDSSGDNRGKFSDRLKKMRRDRLKRYKKEENILKTGSRNLFKILLALPAVAYSVVKSEESNTLKQNDDIFNSDNLSNVDGIRKLKVNKIREMNISALKKKKEIELKKRDKFLQKDNNVDNLSLNTMCDNNYENEEKIIKLQKEIIDLIKKQLVKNINELEILKSELYLLNVIGGDDIYLKECKDKIKEIKKLLSKINSLKEKYDYLKDNYDFEYMYEHGDEMLVDKILELKDLCSSSELKFVIDNYKILEEYKFLYLKIDKLRDDTAKYEDYKKQREVELKKRDINFEQLKAETYNIDAESKRYESFVKEQTFYLKQLEEKINNIDVYERVTYKLKGFSQLVANSFKFMGLMLLNPLKGFIPNIAVHTAMTKNVIHNLYNNLEWQSKREFVYDAVDYSLSINIAQNSLNDTLSLVNSTLDDIAKLKLRFKQEFSKYENSISCYKDTIKKINKMENAIIGNKVKIELMQSKMKIKERENTNKLERVKKLNTSKNN